MSVNMCISCRHYEVVTDNHGKYHGVCTCCESDDFLTKVDCAFHSCDYGEPDIVEDEDGEDEE